MPSQMRLLDFGDGTVPIQLDYPDTTIFSNCDSYGDRVPGSHWNEITLHHRGKLEYSPNRQQIIMDALYQAVNGADFYPVFYQVGTAHNLSLAWGCLSLFNFQRGSKADTLLARNCKAAIDNLFNQRLTISLGAGGSLPISVQLGVAQYKMNQISPTFLIARVVTGLMKRLVQKDGVDGLLDLGSFGDHPEFKNIVVSLGNPCILMTVCQVIHNNDTERFRVNGFILANNQIRNVRPLTLFANVDYALLDLRGNKVS